MNILGIAALSIGIIFLVVCAILLLVFRSHRSLSKSTSGIITGTCRNAASFNAEMERKEYSSSTEKKDTKISKRTSVGTNDTSFDSTPTYYLTYSYEVNGITYQRATNVSMSAGMANKKIGKTINICYNP